MLLARIRPRTPPATPPGKTTRYAADDAFRVSGTSMIRAISSGTTVGMMRAPSAGFTGVIGRAAAGSGAPKKLDGGRGRSGRRRRGRHQLRQKLIVRNPLGRETARPEEQPATPHEPAGK